LKRYFNWLIPPAIDLSIREGCSIRERQHKLAISFTLGERSGGLLVPIPGGILAKIRRNFELMNEALKRECDRRDCNPDR
jgi:hypothetical protein